jgi:hypothetical protein
VRQRMKLTGTNSSIGLIVLIASVHPNMNKPTTCSKIQMRSLTSPASHNALNPQGLCVSCALPTWWLWRGGRTRSLSEHGRETPLRPWYFVLRRGRVGRCQVCQTQLQAKSHQRFMPTQSSHHQRKSISDLSRNGSSRVTMGRYKAAFVASGKQAVILLAPKYGAKETSDKPKGFTLDAISRSSGLR